MIRRILILPILFYRKCISPLFPPCCRYYPSCSAYAMQAIMRFGAVRGMLLTVSRLLRCHPWARGGIDEVPDSFSWKKLPAYFWQKRKGE